MAEACGHKKRAHALHHHHNGKNGAATAAATSQHPPRPTLHVIHIPGVKNFALHDKQSV